MIGKKGPSGPVTGTLAAVCVVIANKPGGTSSSNTNSPPGVAPAVPSAYSPPKVTLRSEVDTPFQTCAACPTCVRTDGRLSYVVNFLGSASETKMVTVLLGRAARSNFSGTGR